MESSGFIRIEGACQNNLKDLTFDLPLGMFHVLTGPSGSGKSSLAFDTLYAEGQRRYAETFSPYTRQFLERMDRPRVRRIEGIPPAIALGQSNPVRSSRSTVGTVTEIADHLKLIFPRLAKLTCPDCSQPVQPWTPHSILSDLLSHHPNEEAWLLFRIPFPQKTPADEAAAFLARQGFRRVLLHGKPQRLDEAAGLEALALALSQTPPEQNLLVPVIQDRITLNRPSQARLAEALTSCLQYGRGVAAISLVKDPTHLHLYSDRYFCPRDQRDFHEPTPALFSFNHPLGACPACRGFGRIIEIDESLALPDRNLTIAGGVVKPWQTASFEDCQQDLEKACRKHRIPLEVPFCELSAAHQKFVLEGQDGSTRELSELWDSGDWYGVRGFFRWLETKTYKMHVRILLARYRAYRPCPTCSGQRYRPETTFWRLSGKTMPELNSLSLSELAALVEKIKTEDASAQTPLENIRHRLRFLLGVGLGYLTLDRPTRTLSGGELQRVNLTGCLGTGLTGTLFVLDEPSIGLHPRDTNRLLDLLRDLRTAGNTVLVVEHDETVIRSAENILELGPGAGSEGGHLLYSGPPAGLLKVKNSPTGAYLSGRRSIPLPSPRRSCPEKGHPWLRVQGADCHNLKNLNANLPLHRLVAVSGVSGSGKSTLVHEVIYKTLLHQMGRAVENPPSLKSIAGYETITDVLLVDQSPLSQTPRSTPLLYLDIYDLVRELYASTEEAQSAGLPASAFSFNAGGGRCERCGGMGYEKVSMQFLSDVFVTCPTCEGHRFQPHVLAAPYLGKSIDQLLEMTAAETLLHFAPRDNLTPRARECHLKICQALSLLIEVGLGYLRCGQPLSQLSGGEAQRLKLVAHLAPQNNPVEAPKPGRKKGAKPPAPHHPLLILDEPTTGLHLDDVALLIRLLHRLVDQGASLLVIEHHLDVLKNADWILDLGPEAGSAGGKLVAAGTPEQVAQSKKSHTATYLAPLLSKKPSPTLRLHEAPPSSLNNRPPQEMVVRGARHHNLKNFDLQIPRHKMVVVTGLSGSGKSTLAFDLLFSEGQRRYLDCLNTYARQFVEQLEKPDVDSITGLPPAVAIEQRTTRGGRKSTVATVTELYQFLRLLYAKLGVQHDPDTGEAAIRQNSADIIKRIQRQLRKSKRLDLLAPLIRGRKGFHTEVARWAIKKGYKLLRVDGKWVEPEKFQPLDRYKEHQIEVLVGQIAPKQKDLPILVSQALSLGKGTLYAIDRQGKSTIHSHHLFCPGTGRSFDELDPRLFSFNSPHGWCTECQGYGTLLAQPPEPETDDEAEKEQQMELAREEIADGDLLPCPSCQGARINPIARSVRFAGKTIPEINSLSVRNFETFFSKVKFTGREATIVRDIQPEILQRLAFLRKVGLDYLNLDRSAPTLSGGESQRIRLAAQLGSNLQGVLYVLDEPTIGLHPRDNQKLLEILRDLRDRGNSLLVVEHDEDTMRAADHIIDLGPGAGVHGGEIVAQGNWRQIDAQGKSATARLLGEPIQHPARGQRRPIDSTTSWIKIQGAVARNIHGIDVSIPLHRLSALSGVSGSGKSTLAREILLPATSPLRSKKDPRWKSVHGAEAIDRVVEVDQSPIGKTPRSTVATYLGLMDHLRTLYASLPVAKQSGFTASHFSHNAGPGRCPACDGAGTIRVQMSFLPPADVRCEECNGLRWKPEILALRYRDLSIQQALSLSAEKAAEFFAPHPRIATPCRLMAETGLGYLQLGQTSPTLSGGEAQRLKLVTELATAQIAADHAHAKGRARRPAHHLFLLEEPTVGLHLADVRRLLNLMHRLVDSGHTVVVIEHHLDVLAEADYLIDIGPESGEAGGTIMSQGTPEQVATSKTSRTAPFLRTHLGRSEKHKKKQSLPALLAS